MNHHKILLWLLIFNVVSTAFHYADNSIFLSQYPGPDWFTQSGVALTWLLMTPFAALGYWLYRQGKQWLAYMTLGFYSITGLFSPGHYVYPRLEPMSLKMHILIWEDFAVALGLLLFLLWDAVQAGGEKTEEKSP